MRTIALLPFIDRNCQLENTEKDEEAQPTDSQEGDNHNVGDAVIFSCRCFWCILIHSSSPALTMLLFYNLLAAERSAF